MMIETFIGMSRYLSPRQDDDWSDRLHYLMTPNILLAFSVLISFKQFGGRPIECMFPNKFPGSWEQYAENYCWSQDTYFVEPKQHVELLKPDQRYDRTKFHGNLKGIRMHEVVEKAKDSANVEEEVRQKNIAILARHLQNALRFHRRMEKRRVIVHKTVTCLNYQYSSGFVSAVYLFTKALYLVNVVLQLWLMNYFLGTNKHQWYGLGVIKDIVNGVEWETSGYFPRSAICDFEVRQVANIQKYSVQCVLVINIFNEKIFVILWFWYLLLFLSAAFTFVSWFFVLLFPCFSRWFIEQHLELSSLDRFDPDSMLSNKYHIQESSNNIRKFVYDYLHRDGVFVLRMVSAHAGIIFGTDLILELWRTFYGIEKKATTPLTPNGDDPLQNELKSVTSVRNRKKQNLMSLLEGGDITTALMPMSPEDDEKQSESSEEDRKP
ncbi:NUC205 domain protein [Ancylostoma duodenale]|uniref:Innexin n=1 Tax=Ancylostoma duodenale TaxID=51022 RepID=A0A0C2GSD5_9BILA|nr:NUC205 domain protein [Ancylostoma duodenale]